MVGPIPDLPDYIEVEIEAVDVYPIETPAEDFDYEVEATDDS